MQREKYLNKEAGRSAMNPLIISTGWYADNRGHNNPGASKMLYRPDWFGKYWFPMISMSMELEKLPEALFVYESNCEVRCDLTEIPVTVHVERVRNLTPAIQQDHRHDWFCSVMMGAEYALCNGCDLVYIEQDCFVKGLWKAIAYAQGIGHIYGYGRECSMGSGWAENSFMYVANDFLPEFLMVLNNRRWFEGKGSPMPEVMWHEVFKNYDEVSFWPFGVGRKRPIPWEDEIYFAQQLTDGEIEKFAEVL